MAKNGFIEDLRIAGRSIKTNKLRTFLTVLIIGIGISALVGILTAVEALKGSVQDSFMSMGANTFSVRNKGISMHGGRKGMKQKAFRKITFQEAQSFLDNYTFPAISSISTSVSRTSLLKYESRKTDPTVVIIGTDENYLALSGYEIGWGRNFTKSEVSAGNNNVVIGNDVANRLFQTEAQAINKIARIDDKKYRIIGVLKSKGSGFQMGADNQCLISIIDAKTEFSGSHSYQISIKPNNAAQMETAVGEATGVFRVVRKVDVRSDNNFEMIRSDSVANTMFTMLDGITGAATLIGLITLLGAAIGLMNIMLVSVTERTREIGIRKAIGATAASIKRQFLMEAVIIGQLGALLGVVLGILIGNIVSLILEGGFTIPWAWVFLGAFLCFGVSVLSGSFPAAKAAALDPIESLRYE